ncbi:MAG: MBL fold metallo-hydrolase [Bacteroidales bacterium]|nr:MBL fold metallo-hydrolase [Bacteroidales bacterium]
MLPKVDYFCTFTFDLFLIMLTLCAIASGSNGNCYYIGNNREAVLVDAGISARQIMNRMKQQNLNPALVKAIFISHEHTDHVCGAKVLSKKLMVPVYVTRRTYAAMYNNHKPQAPRFFDPGTEIAVGSFSVFPFLKNHDAAQPCSFRISYNGLHTGVLTDIGVACENVIREVSHCHALFLETNYDEKMLWEGRYPWPLKRRIASDHGHLSNDQAFDLISRHSGNQLQIVFLSHLSAENNTPEKAMERFNELRQRYQIYLTSRHSPGEVVSITAAAVATDTFDAVLPTQLKLEL